MTIKMRSCPGSGEAHKPTADLKPGLRTLLTGGLVILPTGGWVLLKSHSVRRRCGLLLMSAER